jgi:hypothetical protein
MRIAFDIHGTLDDDGDGLLKSIYNEMVKHSLHPDLDVEVFIISGPSKNQIEKELDKLGIDHKHVTILSVVDWLEEKGVKMWTDENGDRWCDDSLWWKSKGDMCRKYKIDQIFDDHIGYKANMPSSTKFILWHGYSKVKGE